MFVEPLDPYKLGGVRVFDRMNDVVAMIGLSQSGDVDTLWLCDFSPAEEGVNPGPGGCSTRTLCRLQREVDGSLTLKPARSTAICDAWEENNCSTSSWRLTSARKRAAQ